MSTGLTEFPNQSAVYSVKSVNWHVWPHCNYNYKFCFARFHHIDARPIPRDDGLILIQRLVDAGMKKITFVGGEPLLCPWLGDYIQYAKKLGCITMVVSNGARITKAFLNQYASYIDWIGLSLDSGRDLVERTLGRGNGNHISNLVRVSQMIHERGIKLKINVTVTRAVLDEDLHDLIRRLRPDRLKFLQVLHIKGQNDDHIEDLLISKEEFHRFAQKHIDLAPVAEDEEMMTNSYVMIDPSGRFFQNIDAIYNFSDPILNVGVLPALSQVGFSWTRLVDRGGADYFDS